MFAKDCTDYLGKTGWHAVCIGSWLTSPHSALVQAARGPGEIHVMAQGPRLTVTLPVRAAADGPGACPACGVTRELHQPDHGDPDRLLACCGRCGAWALIVRLPDDTAAVEVPLPDGAALASALRSAGAN
jgi:hypothetical protein